MTNTIDYTKMRSGELYALEADQLLVVQNLRREVDEASVSNVDALMAREDDLLDAEDILYAIQQAIPIVEKAETEAEKKAQAEVEATPKSLDPDATDDKRRTRSGRTRRGPLSTGQKTKAFGSTTTLLDVKLKVHMPQVPTAVYHLLDPEEDPLISCELTNNARRGVRRLLVRAQIEHYSAEAVQTVEVEAAG